MHAAFIPAGALALAAVLFVLSGCAHSNQTAPPANEPAAVKDAVRAMRLLDHRIPARKTDVLPDGDVIKRWRWDKPWEIRNAAGEVIRRMDAPDGPSNHDGPIITVIHDPQRGTIYEAYFVQRSTKTFDLPVTLSFFSGLDARTPLFTLSFTDVTLHRCQPGRVSRGGIQHPSIPRPLIESAEWAAVSWDSVPYGGC